MQAETSCAAWRFKGHLYTLYNSTFRREEVTLIAEEPGTSCYVRIIESVRFWWGGDDLNGSVPYGRIVLVHGACHGKWCWEELVPLLESQGYEVDTLDLPGLGDDSTKPVDVTFDAYVMRVVEVIQAKPGPVVLVGHSLGGHTISQVAEVLADRIVRLVYITAMLLQSGESPASYLKDLADSGETSGLRGWRASSIEGAHEVDPDLAPDIFYHKCSIDVAGRAVKRLRPQADAPLAAAANLSAERWGGIPKTYILCTQDQTIPLSAQRHMAGRTPGIKIVEIDSDHSPFYSDTHGIAKLLEKECRQSGMLGSI